ncbi:hypothetical protein QBC44DRAFT_319264 [Cladorrhinum sp. PSN332]|nr:hypothetical protein QBC44DRAFT_319264 [Cladorrhinum sp. PSN332]
MIIRQFPCILPFKFAYTGIQFNNLPSLHNYCAIMLRLPLRKAGQRWIATVLSATHLGPTKRCTFHTLPTLSFPAEDTKPPKIPSSNPVNPEAEQTDATRRKKKTLQEIDEELRQKMEGISGDGGASGVEYEDGKPADMKRSVRENMFRYI